MPMTERKGGGEGGGGTEGGSREATSSSPDLKSQNAPPLPVFDRAPAFSHPALPTACPPPTWSRRWWASWERGAREKNQVKIVSKSFFFPLFPVVVLLEGAAITPLSPPPRAHVSSHHTQGARTRSELKSVGGKGTPFASAVKASSLCFVPPPPPSPSPPTCPTSKTSWA
jgi:hypothetical protein